MKWLVNPSSSRFLSVLLAILSSVSPLKSETLLTLPGFTATANIQLENNPDESLVYVSGTVKKINTPSAENIIAPNITVRFWQPENPGSYVTAITNENGVYTIGLTEGAWQGEACGSDAAYYPSSWQVLVQDKKLLQLQAHDQKTIELDMLTPSNLINQHNTVTLTGRGFGCNGSLVFTYSNSVDICNKSSDIEYDHEVITLNDFSYRTDTQLRFAMPELSDVRDVHKHIAYVRYQQGNYKSRYIGIGEMVLASQSSNVILCQGGQVANQSNVAILNGTLGMQGIVTQIGGTAFNNAGAGVVSGVVGDTHLGGGNNPQLTGSDFASEMSFQNLEIEGVSGIMQFNGQVPNMELNQ